MHRFLIVAGIVTSACSHGAAKPPAEAVTAPLVDPAPAPIDPAPASIDPPAEPAVVVAPPAPPPPVIVHVPEANGQLAVVRVVEGEHTFVDVYEVAAGELHQVSTTELPAGGMFSHQLVWPKAGASIVFRGALTESDGKETFGTIDGGHFTALKPKGKGDVIQVLTSAAGEVWLERCATWDENPEEEGCRKRGYERLTPKPSTATKRPKRRVLPAAVPAPTALTLAVKKHPTSEHNFLLECRAGGGVTTLLADDQVYEAPAWRWLSAEPPIALVAVAYAGMGGGDPEIDDHSYRLLRDCDLAEDSEPYELGPSGLWALQVASEGFEHDWQVRWRGVLLTTVHGEALAFAGGVP